MDVNEWGQFLLAVSPKIPGAFHLPCYLQVKKSFTDRSFFSLGKEWAGPFFPQGKK